LGHPDPIRIGKDMNQAYTMGTAKRLSSTTRLRIGLIDGPVETSHSEFAGHRDRAQNGFPAICLHGTLVAGVLSARRGSLAPAICPECTLLVRAISGEGGSAVGDLPRADALELATASRDCMDAGARLINLSVAIEGF
jgi:hypothetical protein